MTEIAPPSNLSPNIEFCLRLAQETSLSVRAIAALCKISSRTAYRYINQYLGRAFIAQRDLDVSLGRFHDSLSPEAVKEIADALPAPVKSMPHKYFPEPEAIEVIEIVQDGEGEIVPEEQSSSLSVSVGGLRLEFEKGDEQTASLIAKLLARLREEAI